MLIKKIKYKITKWPIYKKNRNKVVLWKDSLKHLYFNRIVSYFPSQRIRVFLLRRAGAEIANGVAIHSGCEFWNPKGLIIEEGSSIGFSCILDARQGLKIGKNVCLASQVMIWSLHHDYNLPDFDAVGGLVEIGDYVWLCSRSIILPGVKIAKGSVVAAGAVVAKNVEAYNVVGGVPAKKIGERNSVQTYNYVPSMYKLHIV